MTHAKQKLLSKRTKRGDCWEYPTTSVWFEGKTYNVGRLGAIAWGIVEVGSKFLVCHHCDNNKCFKPSHLFLGTYADNTSDMMLKGRYVPCNVGSVLNRVEDRREVNMTCHMTKT